MRRPRSPLQSRRQTTHDFTEKDIITLRHNMMMVYGWIPTEEFRKEKVQTLMDLAKPVAEEVLERMKTMQYIQAFVKAHFKGGRR